MNGDSETRRGFLKAAMAAMAGAMTAVLGVPLVRYILHPVGRKTVESASGPIDVAALADLEVGAAPVKVDVVARSVRDAWGVQDDVAVGAAWLARDESGEVRALSSICPHLGCAVAFDEGENEFRCPCHRSAFAADGDRISGPSKRGLDPLPVKVEDGRVKLTFVRYRSDVADREPV